ncbi:hypothetical protein Droror1_Dr00004544 [Drosera rotundifolia]
MVGVEDDDGPRKRQREAMDRVTSVTNGAQKSKKEDDLIHDPIDGGAIDLHNTVATLGPEKLGAGGLSVPVKDRVIYRKADRSRLV